MSASRRVVLLLAICSGCEPAKTIRTAAAPAELLPSGTPELVVPETAERRPLAIPPLPDIEHIGYELEEWNHGTPFHVTFARIRVRNATSEPFSYISHDPLFAQEAQMGSGWMTVTQPLCMAFAREVVIEPGAEVVLKAHLPSEGIVRLGLATRATPDKRHGHGLRPAKQREAFADFHREATTIWTGAIPPLDSHWSPLDGLPPLIPSPF